MAEFQIIKLYKDSVELKYFPLSHQYWVDGKRATSVTGAINIIDKSKQLLGWAVGTAGDFLSPYVGKKLTQELLDEAIEQYTIKKEDASNIGTQAHEWMELFVKGGDPIMPKDKNVLQAVTGFLKWVEEHEVKFLESEKFLFSKKYGYVGTMDATAKIGGKSQKFLIDYKVSNGLYPGVAYQTAAYLKADEEESKNKYEGRWAIRLAKETEEEYYKRQETKLNKYLKKNPGKSPYQIEAYVPFEAKYLDDSSENLENDFKGFLECLNLSKIHSGVEKRFFPR